MQEHPEWANLVKDAKECQNSKRSTLECFLASFARRLSRNFQSSDDELSEEDFLEKQTFLQYAAFSMSLIVENHTLTIDEVLRLLRHVIDASCSIRDAEIAESFDRLLSILVGGASKLSETQYDSVLGQLLDVLKYCTEKSENSPNLLAPKALFRLTIDDSDFFRRHVVSNTIAAVFGENSRKLRDSSVFLRFWPLMRQILLEKSEEIDENREFSTFSKANCLRGGLKLLETSKNRRSVVERAAFVSELFPMLRSLIPDRSELKSVLTELFQKVGELIEEQGKVLQTRKELRDGALEWLHDYLEFIDGDGDDYGLLEPFATWIVELTDEKEHKAGGAAAQEIPETAPESCLEIIEILVPRIKAALQSDGVSNCLHNYLDILASLYKLSRIQKPDAFNWIVVELEKHNSMENPRWPRLLAALLAVRHSACQHVFRKFAPSADSLWSRIRDDSPRGALNTLALVVASCQFLNHHQGDEHGKLLLPILLLPCLRDLRERYPSKWDHFRLHTSSRSQCELSDLEKYTQIDVPEPLKLRAAQCALQIEKKSVKLGQLAAEMSISVLASSRSDRIRHCLPPVIGFCSDPTTNGNYISEFLGVLIHKLAEHHTAYAEHTILALGSAVRRLVCLAANRKEKEKNHRSAGAAAAALKVCSKCSKRGQFVAPDDGGLLGGEQCRIDEPTLSVFVKACLEKRDGLSEGVLGELLEVSRVCLIHVASPTLPAVFAPIVKVMELGFGASQESFFRVWELLNAKSSSEDELKLQVYVPVIARALSTLKPSSRRLKAFLERTFDARLAESLKVAVFAGIFAHTAILEVTVDVDDEEDPETVWGVISNWIYAHSHRAVEPRSPRAMVRRYATILTRSFVARLLLDVATSPDVYDEVRTREAARTFVTRLAFLFDFPTLSSCHVLLRPTLLYWSLVAGARGQSTKHVCSLIDFLCQELVPSKTSGIPANPSEVHILMAQRKALVKETFLPLIQLWTIEKCRGNEGIWKFCEDHCDFNETDTKALSISARKEIFERLLLVAPELFVATSSESPSVVVELQRVYENLKRGEKFSLATAMDTRLEGTVFLFAFRRYFTSDVHFWMQNRAADAFRVVLLNLKPEFFDVNWYPLLMTLRLSPRHLESTRAAWCQFVELLNYSTLRQNLWRILSDVSRIPHNEDVIERIWSRLSYANDIDKCAIDALIQRFFWAIPLEVEKRVDLSFTIGKSRRVDDVFEFIRNFERFPSLQFVDNLSSKIDRGTVWKDDLPRLLGALTGLLPLCHSAAQRRQLCSVVQKLPVQSAELADHDFVRWDASLSFFVDPLHLTQSVLDECQTLVENMDGEWMEYADRTMCEVNKYFGGAGGGAAVEEDSDSKSAMEGVRFMYNTMNAFQKPEPTLIEQKTCDELAPSAGGAAARQIHASTFAGWLTVLIVKCAEMAGSETPLASLVAVAHVGDVRFLSKLAMRFILTIIHLQRQCVTEWILSTFEEALLHHSHSSTGRGACTFIFYTLDFLYFYINSTDVRKKKNEQTYEQVKAFWKTILMWTVKDEHGHEQPLVVKVAAEQFGMEKRCILWLEMHWELRKEGKRAESHELEAVFYFTLMNLYARIHELNGVRGAFARLSRVQIDHVYGKICLKEAVGDVSAAASYSQMTGRGKAFDATDAIRKMIEEQKKIDVDVEDRAEQESRVKALKQLGQWVRVEKDQIAPSPHVFTRSIESRATELSILQMIRGSSGNEVDDRNVDTAIESARENVLKRLSEHSLGGSCSYETATPFIVELQQLDEICRLKSADKEALFGIDSSDFWRALQKRVDDGEQRMDYVEPILRARRSMLETKMRAFGEREKEEIRSRIVEAHLQSARIARLTGCHELAQLAIINAKKVLPFDNKIVLEEAKLQLQTSDTSSGMMLLDSILDKTFGELSKHYGDTQQSANLDLQTTAKSKLDGFPAETKSLFSAVQMLRISHMIKAGNTIGFEKIYNETFNLLTAFVSSGVMYEAAWLLDYLFHYNERNRTVLPLLKAFKDVAKYEKNHVLQARAVERMMSLWLNTTMKMHEKMSSKATTSASNSEMCQSIRAMNREILSAVDRIGWRAFYPAYAVLVRHIDHPDPEVFQTIKKIMQQLVLRMPHQCMWQSVHLLRQDIALVKERYMDVLKGVKMKSALYATLIDQYDYASAVFNQVSEKVASSSHKLSEKVPGLKLLLREKRYDPKGLIMDRRPVNAECKTMFGIMVPVRSVLDGSVHSSEFSTSVSDSSELNAELSCQVPDRYLIHDFSETVRVLQSKTKPVLIELTTMAGKKVRLICKKEDDLTKDYYFTKMVEMCNDLLIKDEQTRIQNMAATTYSVIPLAKHGGIIEFMEGVTPYYETLDKLIGRTQFDTNELITKWWAEMKPLKREARAEYFRKKVCAKTPLVMAKWFRIRYPEAGKWFAARKLFAKSSAVMSMIGYIFGLGDRHTKNLMVHVPTGKCVHVDFDMIFNKGETLGTPEVVPFRLTRNMVNGMGEVNLDGEFRAVCEQTLRVFRENSYEIEKFVADLPNLVEDIKLKDFDMSEAKRCISGRLRGQIVTAKLYRSNPILHPMQVSQLAASLIELATSDEKLCEMFGGWMPHL